MNVKGIVARFLPLLDVITCLLGMFILLLAVAKIDSSPTTGAEKIRILFLLLTEKGKTVQKIDPNTMTLEFFKTESDEDIRKFFEGYEDVQKLILLCSKEGDEDDLWTNDRKDELITLWKLNERKIMLERLKNLPNDFLHTKQENLQ